jgi:hypothetical protein
MIFYSAFGNGASSVLYAIIGLLLDSAKVVFIGLLAYFIRDADRYFTAIVVCMIFWLALSILSLLASIGFLSQINEEYEAERLKDSAIYAQHQAAVKTRKLG